MAMKRKKSSPAKKKAMTPAQKNQKKMPTKSKTTRKGLFGRLFSKKKS